MKCPRCGYQIENDELKKCPVCDYVLNDEETPSAEVINPVPKKKGLFVFEERPDQYTRGRHLLTIGFYFFTIYILAIGIQFILLFLYTIATGNKPDSIGAQNFVSIWSQIVTYLLLLIGIVLLLRHTIVDDLCYTKNHFGRTMALVGIGVGMFYAVNIALNIFYTIIDGLFGLGIMSGDSGNQSAIVEMINNANPIELILYGLVIVVVAPLVEELIFRKAIFSALKGKKPIVKIVISALCFGGIHVLSTIVSIILARGAFINIVKEVIYSLTYIAMGGVLGFIYAANSENTFTSFLVHVVNNGLSLIAILLTPLLQRLSEMQ